MKRLIIVPALVAAVATASASCGSSPSGAIETLPPIRTTTTTTTTTTLYLERVYIVQEGDNLSEIARRYSVTVDRIIALNRLPADGTIQPDQELRIPNIQVDRTLPPDPDASEDTDDE
jgi:LysM repeat protein